MNKHTAGPWQIEPVAATLSTNQSDFLITHSDGELRSHIARLFDSSLCDEHGTTSANARLIAAAPDLLAALEDLVGYAAAEIGIPPNEAVGGAFKQARAAIAKAKGQQ